MAEVAQTDQLCNAAARGDLHEVLLQLEQGVEVNEPNSFGRTALQVAKLGHPAVIRALLEAAADPDRPDPACGLTVTHDAAREGFADTVSALLEFGADANALDAHGNLPLHLAARHGHPRAVAMLLPFTADPRRPNGLGHTAHQLAQGHPAVAALIGQYLNE